MQRVAKSAQLQKFMRGPNKCYISKTRSFLPFKVPALERSHRSRAVGVRGHMIGPMASMQQIDCKRLDSIIDASVNAMDHEAGQYQVVAFHRRSSIFLSYVKRSEEFIYIEHRDLREPKWYTVGAWKCPEEITNSCKLIATLSIESYDMFVYVVGLFHIIRDIHRFKRQNCPQVRLSKNK